MPKTTRVGTRANRQGCAADNGGHDRQGTPDPEVLNLSNVTSFAKATARQEPIMMRLCVSLRNVARDGL